MTHEELRELSESCKWAETEEAPAQAKILLKEIQRRLVDWTGDEMVCQKPPENRIHECVELNLMNIPVAWIEYEERYGFVLITANMYGDGAVVDDIKFCPFCGDKLIAPKEPVENLTYSI